MHPKVDEFINTLQKWQAEISLLQAIALECGLMEEFKWRNPCYSYQENNILILGSFKEYCTLSFFKGSLLRDNDHTLEQPGKNSQAVRMFKFKNLKDIQELKPTIKNYIYEAIEIEKAGLKVAFKSNSELELVAELQQALDKNTALKTAFEALTPGRQRGYNLYFSGSKQPKTRETRIEKYIPRILDGMGINDCVCGRSKKISNCDGSHKYL